MSPRPGDRIGPRDADLMDAACLTTGRSVHPELVSEFAACCRLWRAVADQAVRDCCRQPRYPSDAQQTDTTVASARTRCAVSRREAIGFLIDTRWPEYRKMAPPRRAWEHTDCHRVVELMRKPGVQLYQLSKRDYWWGCLLRARLLGQPLDLGKTDAVVRVELANTSPSTVMWHTPPRAGS